MHQPAFNDEVVAWNFKIELLPHRCRFREFNSRTAVGKIDNGALQPAAVVGDQNCRFKYRSSTKLPPLRSLIYRQSTLISSFGATIARITCNALKAPFCFKMNYPIGLHLNLENIRTNAMVIGASHSSLFPPQRPHSLNSTKATLRYFHQIVYIGSTHIIADGAVRYGRSLIGAWRHGFQS